METIRKAEPRDASRLAEIAIFSKRLNYRGIFNDDAVSFGEMQVLPLALEYLSAPERLENILVYDDGLVKGYARLEGRELAELYVEPFFTGLGVGSALLRRAEELGAERLWVLEKNVRAAAFYERHGFRLNGERRREDGTAEYAVMMVLPPSPNS